MFLFSNFSVFLFIAFYFVVCVVCAHFVFHYKIPIANKTNRKLHYIVVRERSVQFQSQGLFYCFERNNCATISTSSKKIISNVFFSISILIFNERLSSHWCLEYKKIYIPNSLQFSLVPIYVRMYWNFLLTLFLYNTL